jgi:type 1 glutamine amidotransferase
MQQQQQQQQLVESQLEVNHLSLSTLRCLPVVDARVHLIYRLWHCVVGHSSLEWGIPAILVGADWSAFRLGAELVFAGQI